MLVADGIATAPAPGVLPTAVPAAGAPTSGLKGLLTSVPLEPPPVVGMGGLRDTEIFTTLALLVGLVLGELDSECALDERDGV